MKNDEEKSAELILYGSIGSDEYWDDISDKAFKQDIENLGDVENITLHINSPGGSVFSAVAIANTLKNHKAKITANIDGLAASAATIITSACDTVRMPKNALFMVHNPITFAYGSNQDMQKTLEMLNKIKNSIIETYLNKTKTDKKTRGRPTKLLTWIEAFQKVVNEDINAVILTDDELRMLTNDLVEEKQQIADRTFESWKAGDVKDPLYFDFLRLYKKALTIQKKNLFKKLQSDDEKWQKYAWIIERKFDDWNLRNKQEVTGKDGKDLQPFQVTGIIIK